MKYKLFISQPMKDKTNEEIEATRLAAIKSAANSLGVDAEDIEVIDSFFKNAPHDAKPMWFLGESIKLLSEANVVYFAKGWDKYRGCNIEYECARAYNTEVIILA